MRDDASATNAVNVEENHTRQGGAISWMKIREVLALNLRKCRQAEELADRAKIDRTYVSAIERSVYAATIDVVDRLARGLGVEAADLLRRPSAARTPGKKE